MTGTGASIDRHRTAGNAAFPSRDAKGLRLGSYHRPDAIFLGATTCVNT